MDKHLIYQVMRFIIVLCIIIIAIFSLKYLLKIFYPFAIAFLLSFLINPLVCFLEKKMNLSRFISTIIVILLFFIFSTSALLLIIAELIDGTLFLAKIVPSYYKFFIEEIQSFLNNKVAPIYHKLIAFVQTLNESQQTKFYEYIDNLTNTLAASGTNLIEDFLIKIPNILSIIPYSFTIIILIFITTFLITKDWYQLKDQVNKFVPLRIKNITKRLINQLEKSLFGYIKSQFIIMLISASLILIGLMLLKVDHAITITFFIALIDIIPIFGIGVVFIPWIIYLFLIQEYYMTISLSILYMIIIIMRQIIEPKILSTNIGINPLAALMVLFIGFQIWGIAGIIISPFLLIIISAIYKSGTVKFIWDFIRG